MEIENIKFSISDKTYTKDTKGWLNAPQNASWWVNPRGKKVSLKEEIELFAITGDTPERVVLQGKFTY